MHVNEKYNPCYIYVFIYVHIIHMYICKQFSREVKSNIDRFITILLELQEVRNIIVGLVVLFAINCECYYRV